MKKVMKNSLWIISIVLVISGCSAKEFSDGANDIGNDISHLFDVRE